MAAECCVGQVIVMVKKSAYSSQNWVISFSLLLIDATKVRQRSSSTVWPDIF